MVKRLERSFSSRVHRAKKLKIVAVKKFLSPGVPLSGLADRTRRDGYASLAKILEAWTITRVASTFVHRVITITFSRSSFSFSFLPSLPFLSPFFLLSFFNDDKFSTLFQVDVHAAKTIERRGFNGALSRTNYRLSTNDV